MDNKTRHPQVTRLGQLGWCQALRNPTLSGSQKRGASALSCEGLRHSALPLETLLRLHEEATVSVPLSSRTLTPGCSLRTVRSTQSSSLLQGEGALGLPLGVGVEVYLICPAGHKDPPLAIG